MRNQFGRKSTTDINRSRAHRLRKLRIEKMEDRRLLAVGYSPLHNDLVAEDVNQDFRVTATDALLIINRLNENVRASGESSESSMRFDVNNDGRISASDALSVINRLNGEGADPILMRYSYSITNSSDTPITQVAVGSDFIVSVFAQDARTNPNPNAPTNIRGPVLVASDLGISSLGLADYIAPTNFRSGIQFSNQFPSDRGGAQGGGIYLGNGILPTVADGQTFTVTVGSTTRTFELDTNSSVTSGRTAVTLPSSGTIDFTQLGNALVTAINGAGLGITSRYNGETVVVLPTTATFNAGTTAMSVSRFQDEFFNEIRALANFLVVDPNPLEPKLVYQVRFTATNPGVLTFNPNGPDDDISENGLYNAGSDPNPAPVPLPNSFINFGSPFSITIISDPTGPRAVNDTLTTNEDTNLTISNATLLGNDTSGATPARTLTVSSIQTIPGVTKGTISGNVYRPPANFNNTNNGNTGDRLTYTVTDTAGLTATATITINVTPVNDAPTAANDTLTAAMGIANNLDVLANDSAGPLETEQTLTITSVGTAANGTVTIATGGRSVIYTPNTGFVGTNTFTYTIQDSGTPALTATGTVTVTVAPPTRPFAVSQAVTVNEDSTNNRINVLSDDLVNTGQKATLISIPRNPTNGQVTIDNNGTPSDASDDTVLYTPNANFFGSDSFTYAMNETNGTGANSIGTVVITVTGVNDRPVLQNDPAAGVVIATEENVALTIPFTTLTANDSPGPSNESSQTLTVNSVTAVTSGNHKVEISGTNVIYTPAPSFSGDFLFTYNAVDNGSPALNAATRATVTVTVNPFNDPPVLTRKSVSGTEDTALTIPFTTILAGDNPGPGESTQTLTVTAVSAVTAGAGTVAISGTNVIYTPAVNFNGPFVFNYTARDNGVPAKSSVGTVTVNVAAVNDAPTAGADNANSFKNVDLTIPVAQLLANDSPGPANESSQTLSIVGVSGATNGSVRLAGSNVVFTPNANFVGTASFQYTLQDSGGGSTNQSTGTVTITIQDFRPSSIAGTVWVDETKDGKITAQERMLGGVKITLSGSSQGRAITPITTYSLSDGTYEFKQLGPGNYQVTFDRPMYGESSTFFASNSYTVAVPNQGGVDAVRNYSVFGIDASTVTKLSRLMGQLVSQLELTQTTIPLNGSMFAIGSNNQQKWAMKLDGFEDALYTEAVFNGSDLIVTIVDSNREVKSARVTSQFFRMVTDSAGNKLVRLLGPVAGFTWQSTNSRSAAVDALFAQRGWQ